MDIVFARTWVNPGTPPPPPFSGGGRTDIFRRGRVTVRDGLFTLDGKTYTYGYARALAFSSSIPDYSGTINPGDRGFKPLAFSKGRVTVRVRPATTNLLLTRSPTHQWVNGRVSVVVGGVPSVGALTDFAVWLPTQSDPQQFYVETATALTSGGVGESYNRHSAVFVPRRDAKYLGVGTKVLNVPTKASGPHYVQKFMLEKAHLGGTFPSAPYSKAREIRVTVKPDRLNYSVNPRLAIDTTNWTGVAREARGVYFIGAVTGNTVTHTVPNLVVGRTYVASLYADADETSSVTPSISSGATMLAASSAQVSASPGRVSVVFTATATTVVLQVVVSSLTTNLYQTLVERGTTVRPYFDGSSNADTIWERGGTIGKTRSYLYTNRASRYDAIKRVLKENVPMGIGVAEPIFGTLPAD
jgi:hypothetical protein